MSESLDITPAQMKTVRSLLRRHLPGVAAWAYGSRVKWTSRPESDLDLVVFASPDQQADVSALREAFEESNLPFRVDLFVWDEVPEKFRKTIKAERFVVQEEKKGGRMGDEWRETTLGDVIELKRGYDLPKRERTTGHVPLVSSSGVTDYLGDAKVKGPGVVTGRYGTLGQVFFIPEDFWPLNTTLYVRDFKGNHPRFVSYFLRGLDFLAYSDKAAVPGLNRNHLHQAVVRVPRDVNEQRAIAEILGSLDDKIELNRRMNGTLESMARAIFKAWFIDFEPVKAKAAGAASFPGIPQHLFDQLPNKLTNSELGLIPEGWEVVHLDDLFEINPRRSLKKGQVAPYLAMADMPTQGHAPDQWKERAFGSGMRFENNDTLIARITPCLENGKTAFVDFLPTGAIGWGSTEYIVLRPRPPLPPIFAYCLARLPEFRDFAITNMTGTSGRQRVATTSLTHFKTTRPPDAVAVAFGEVVEPMFAKAATNYAESRTLAAIRDALLPKLISGEIRVSEAESAVEEVL